MAAATREGPAVPPAGLLGVQYGVDLLVDTSSISSRSMILAVRSSALTHQLWCAGSEHSVVTGLVDLDLVEGKLDLPAFTVGGGELDGGCELVVEQRGDQAEQLPAAGPILDHVLHDTAEVYRQPGVTLTYRYEDRTALAEVRPSAPEVPNLPVDVR